MKNGEYELVKAPEEFPGEKYRGKYCYEHHLVWWDNKDQLPGDGEVIHHKNEDKRDNRIENLEKLTVEEHISHHQKNKFGRVIFTECAYCGAPIAKNYEESSIGNGKDAEYCDRSCGGKLARKSRGNRELRAKKVFSTPKIIVEVPEMDG